MCFNVRSRYEVNIRKFIKNSIDKNIDYLENKNIKKTKKQKTGIPAFT